MSKVVSAWGVYVSAWSAITIIFILDIVQYLDSNDNLICSSAQDIMLRDEAKPESGKKLNKKIALLQSHISYRIRYSLRVMIKRTLAILVTIDF
jgi:hypothetical protein